MEEQDELELTQEQLKQICRYADSIKGDGVPTDAKKLAFALKAVALCLHRLQAGDPESPVGAEVDRWYDQVIGQDVRMMWMQVKPVAENLKKLGILE